MSKVTTGSILGAILVLASLGGLIWKGVDVVRSQDALASDLKQVEQRLDLKILEDRAWSLRERLWDLERRYGQMEARILPEYKAVQADLRETELRIQALIPKREGE